MGSKNSGKQINRQFPKSARSGAGENVSIQKTIQQQ
eukprot:CAMPEP_0168623360 /NCGR_PEP_ID=MMETSP0449_2-20121227/8780_1 /TAXON_ID=1082188 /ORGANISM="Strombidium rassoulzadegani, Strain ras09" /LENGTH=35 /DNA_ID= /DNA_START= /DNA_END= /DNA_ORIENTATION=